MTTKLVLVCAALAAALLVSLPGAYARTDATARAAADPGVTATTIELGGTAPLSGVASAYAAVSRGAKAYFDHVNARGGVHGRKISYRIVDDAYEPARTVQATRQLVEQDQVFAIFNALGTEHNLAIRDYLNSKGVPHLFVASGATTWGRDYKQYPWTIGFQPSYQAEGWIYGKYLGRTRPGTKVAVLAQNDDYGKDMLVGLKRGLARSNVRVVAAENYEVTASDVQSQIAKLKASGANVLAVFATPRFAIQAYVFANKLNWKPFIINNAVSSASNIMTLASEGGQNKTVEGSLSIVFLKDPSDPKWTNDPAMKLYRSVLSRYARGANAKDVYHVYGMAVAYATVEMLQNVGKNLTRAALRAQYAKLNSVKNPFLLPGIAVKTTATERFPIEQALLQRWSKGAWHSFGGLWGFRAG